MIHFVGISDALVAADLVGNGVIVAGDDAFAVVDEKLVGDGDALVVADLDTVDNVGGAFVVDDEVVDFELDVVLLQLGN